MRSVTIFLELCFVTGKIASPICNQNHDASAVHGSEEGLVCNHSFIAPRVQRNAAEGLRKAWTSSLSA